MISHKKYLTKEELKHLQKELDSMRHDRYALLIQFALMTGARRSEVMSLRKEDFTESTVVIRGAKKSNERELPIPRWFIKAFMEFHEEQPFMVPPTTLHLRWTQYRPNKIKPFHSLRHTFAMELYKKSKDIRLVKYALGHKDVRNTMIYQDYVYQVSEMRKYF